MGYLKSIPKMPANVRPMDDNDIYLFNPDTNDIHINNGLQFYVIPKEAKGIEIYELTEMTIVDNLNRFRSEKRVFIDERKMETLFDSLEIKF